MKFLKITDPNGSIYNYSLDDIMAYKFEVQPKVKGVNKVDVAVVLKPLKGKTVNGEIYNRDIQLYSTRYANMEEAQANVSIVEL